MKIPRNEFKTVIKECLKELISEGALNNAIAQLIQTQGIPVTGMQGALPTDPRIQAVAQSVARNGGDAKLYEAIFADAMGTMAYQNGVDPQLMMQPNNMNNMNMMQPMMSQAPMAGNYYPQGYQQPMMPQYAQQMPMQQPMMPQQPQQQLMLHQQQQGGNISRWAQLAFNSPIKNRPDGDGALPGMGNGGSPGSNMGKFD
jgi:hypothetical protein